MKINAKKYSINIAASDIIIKVSCDEIMPTGTALHCTSRRLTVYVRWEKWPSVAIVIIDL